MNKSFCETIKQYRFTLNYLIVQLFLEIGVSTLASFSQPAAAALARIQSISRWMRWLTLSGSIIALMVVLLTWFWIPASELEAFLREVLAVPATWPAMQLSLTSRAIGFLITGVGTGLLICALLQAHRMFSAFAQGEVFTMKTALCLRRMALALSALGLVIPLTKTVLAAVLVSTSQETYGFILFTLSDYFLCLLGGLLLVIAWAMVEATRIAEENESFV